MTYCLGMKLNEGIVMISDSRTSAGVDDISSYSKMWKYGVPGERQFVICSAGNLATTQAVINRIESDIATQNPISLLTVKSLTEASQYIGSISVECQKKHTGGGPGFESTFLLGGEIIGAPSGLHLIYSQGNFISSSSQVPFLQIGEVKYGKPILDRVIQPETSIDKAALCGLVSMDATIRSNLTVGPPIEMYVLDAGSLQPGRYLYFNEENEYLHQLRRSWNLLMQKSFEQLQPLKWEK